MISNGGQKLKTWSAMSKYVRTIEPNCVTCGKRTTEAGHYEPNGERNKQLGGNKLWFDLRNVHGQCFGCNRFGSRQKMMTRYAIFLEKKYGKGVLQKLKNLRDTLKKWTIEELKEKEREFNELRSTSNQNIIFSDY